MRTAIAGRDTLALMPTGWESRSYQLAAMLRPEPTLVLSPLIALMEDQVDGFRRDRAPPRRSSTTLPARTASRLAGASSGETRLVDAYPNGCGGRAAWTVADVGIGSRGGRGALREHVGHDFRPDYLLIRRGLEALGEQTLLGMTCHGDAGDGARGR